jgi:hypothetical protein
VACTDGPQGGPGQPGINTDFLSGEPQPLSYTYYDSSRGAIWKGGDQRVGWEEGGGGDQTDEDKEQRHCYSTVLLKKWFH